MDKMIQHCAAIRRIFSEDQKIVYGYGWEDALASAPPAPVSDAPISYVEGKKLYDQGWNDGIDHLAKLLGVVVEARMRGLR